MTTRTDLIKVNCFKCQAEVTFVWDSEYEFDPEHDQHACRDCARAMGDYSMYYCWHCGAQFQQLKAHPIFEPESCSDECQDAIDEGVELAVQRQYDYIERRLEAL